MNLIKLLTVEAQKNVDVYHLIGDLYKIFNQEHWVKEYIFWELKCTHIDIYIIRVKNSF